MEDTSLDLLHFRNEKSIIKGLGNGEHIILTVALYKFNESNKRQERNLMITNKKIYNLNKTSITRSTNICKVYAVTLSITGSEFVIHIPDEYDYRYASFDRRDEVIISILRARGQLPLYFKDDIQLIPFTTTKIDKKKGTCRVPTCAEIRMDEQLYVHHSRTEKAKSQEVREKTKTLITKRETQVALDDFNVLRVLGRGAFGKVTLVEKKDTKELFAMKSLKKEEIKDDEQMQHVKTERQVLESVQHPFLVSLVYAFQTPDKLYFVTPFMKGGELFVLLRNSKRFSETKSRFYTSELLLAIEYLHSKKILFRDLKLENVLLDEFGHLRLTDYGLSKIMLKEDRATTLCGTPHYLAPEVIAEQAYSYQIDWWALGVCLYEFLFGFPPFYSHNQDMMFHAIQKKDVAFPSAITISSEAKDLISRLLTKDPLKRIGSQRDSEEIKLHPWFKGMNWAQLLTKEIEPPYVPKTQNEDWLHNFDEQYTKEELLNSYAEQIDKQQFNDWEY